MQACGGIMLAVILVLMLGSNREMGTLLTLGVCAMVAIISMTYLRPVVALVNSLQEIGNLDGDLVRILMKAAGIGLLTEIAGLICADAGNASLGKSVQILGSSVILWLSLPLFTAVMDLLREILGAL